MSNQRQRFADQRYVFFVTFSVYKRRRLLDLDQPKRIVLGVLNHLLESMEGKCVGFVLMPDHVHALIWLERESQKKIVIGKAGSVLKQAGTLARQELRELIGERVHLELWVKVRPKWSRRDRDLTHFGYKR